MAHQYFHLEYSSLHFQFWAGTAFVSTITRSLAQYGMMMKPHGHDSIFFHMLTFAQYLQRFLPAHRRCCDIDHETEKNSSKEALLLSLSTNTTAADYFFLNRSAIAPTEINDGSSVKVLKSREDCAVKPKYPQLGEDDDLRGWKIQSYDDKCYDRQPFQPQPSSHQQRQQLPFLSMDDRTTNQGLTSNSNSHFTFFSCYPSLSRTHFTSGTLHSPLALPQLPILLSSSSREKFVIITITSLPPSQQLAVDGSMMLMISTVRLYPLHTNCNLPAVAEHLHRPHGNQHQQLQSSSHRRRLSRDTSNSSALVSSALPLSTSHLTPVPPFSTPNTCYSPPSPVNAPFVQVQAEEPRLPNLHLLSFFVQWRCFFSMMVLLLWIVMRMFRKSSSAHATAATVEKYARGHNNHHLCHDNHPHHKRQQGQQYRPRTAMNGMGMSSERTMVQLQEIGTAAHSTPGRSTTTFNESRGAAHGQTWIKSTSGQKTNRKHHCSSDMISTGMTNSNAVHHVSSQDVVACAETENERAELDDFIASVLKDEVHFRKPPISRPVFTSSLSCSPSQQSAVLTPPPPPPRISSPQPRSTPQRSRRANRLKAGVLTAVSPSSLPSPAPPRSSQQLSSSSTIPSSSLTSTRSPTELQSSEFPSSMIFGKSAKAWSEEEREAAFTAALRRVAEQTASTDTGTTTHAVTKPAQQMTQKVSRCRKVDEISCDIGLCTDGEQHSSTSSSSSSTPSQAPFTLASEAMLLHFTNDAW